MKRLLTLHQDQQKQNLPTPTGLLPLPELSQDHLALGLPIQGFDTITGETQKPQCEKHIESSNFGVLPTDGMPGCGGHNDV